MFNLKSVKVQLILCLVCFAFFLAFQDKDLQFLGAIVVAVSAAVATEALLVAIKTKKGRGFKSAIITGLIVGYVLSSDEFWGKIAAVSVLAITSKYFVRLPGKHLFNPAALGVLLGMFLLGASTQWRGTYYWPIIVPLGVYLAARVRKLEVVAGYAVVTLILFGAKAYSQQVSLLSIFGYLSYFYIFVMVIEPRTSPVSSRDKYMFGAGVAVLIFIMTEMGARFDAELASLLVMNAVMMLSYKPLSIKGGV